MTQPISSPSPNPYDVNLYPLNGWGGDFGSIGLDHSGPSFKIAIDLKPKPGPERSLNLAPRVFYQNQPHQDLRLGLDSLSDAEALALRNIFSLAILPNCLSMGLLTSFSDRPRVYPTAESPMSGAAVSEVQRPEAPEVVSRPAQPRREERIDLAGNPDHGEILYLRQFHFVPGMAPETLAGVSQYQLRILQELESLRPKHVFMEGLYEDVPREIPREK